MGPGLWARSVRQRAWDSGFGSMGEGGGAGEGGGHICYHRRAPILEPRTLNRNDKPLSYDPKTLNREVWAPSLGPRVLIPRPQSATP